MVSEGPPRGVTGGGRPPPGPRGEGRVAQPGRPSGAQGQGPSASCSGSGPLPRSPSEETEAQTS